MCSWGSRLSRRPAKGLQVAAQSFLDERGFPNETPVSYRLPARFIEGMIRKISLRLPLKTLYNLSYLCVPLNWFYWKVGRFIPGVRELILGTIRCDRNWRISHIDTFDWYHPQYQFHFPMEEVEGWFREKGLGDVYGVESKGMRGRKPVAQAVGEVA